jgi:hypothetical protein
MGKFMQFSFFKKIKKKKTYDYNKQNTHLFYKIFFSLVNLIIKTKLNLLKYCSATHLT